MPCKVTPTRTRPHNTTSSVPAQHLMHKRFPTRLFLAVALELALIAACSLQGTSASGCCSTVAVPKYQSANNTVDECKGELARTLGQRAESLPSCPNPWTKNPSKHCCIEVGALSFGECWCLPGMGHELGSILKELEDCNIPNAATGATC